MMRFVTKASLFATFFSLTCGLFSTPTAAGERQPIALVYDGDGACAEGCWSAAALMAERVGLTVRYINATTWGEEKFRDAVVWIQPGGMSTTVGKTMTHEQKERLRKFVADGGGYVGFCAGAFIASQAIRKAKDGTISPVETFNLIPMITKMYAQESKAEAWIYQTDWFGASRHLYWEGGPYFEGAAPAGVEVVSHYPDGSIAAVRNRYGKGRVFVVGYHPEAPDAWRTYFRLSDPDGLDYALAEQMIGWVLSK